MKAPEAIEALSALASEARLAAYRLLVKRGPSGYTPSELSTKLDMPGTTLSFHLKELMNAGLISSRRDGRNLYYSADIEGMRALMAFLTENCCTLADEACDENCRPVSGAQQKRRA